MAWIESHQSLKESHKLYDLMTSLDWDRAEALGRLHLFWYWCVDHAENGDLRKFNDGHLALAAELSPKDGKRFVEAMVNAGFLDKEPYFRLHDWWDHFGKFLKGRYKSRPDEWKKVESLYKAESDSRSTPELLQSDSRPAPDVIESIPTPPNRTEPNLTEPREGKGETSSPSLSQKKFKRPELDDLRKAFEGKGLSSIEALDQSESFQAYHDSKGWVVGKVQMKDWKGAVVTWIKNQKKWNKENGNTRNEVEPVRGQGF